MIVDNLDTQEVVLDTADLATTVDFALCSIAVARSAAARDGGLNMSVSASDIQAGQQNARAPEDILVLTQQGFWRRHRLQMAVAGVALAIAAGLTWLMLAGDNSPAAAPGARAANHQRHPTAAHHPHRRRSNSPPPQQKMIEQPKMVTPEVKPPDKPDDKPLDKPKAADKDDAPPPGPLALDAKADGPGDVFGLGGKPGGRGLLGGGRRRRGQPLGLVRDAGAERHRGRDPRQSQDPASR